MKLIKSNIILFLLGELNEYDKFGLSVFQKIKLVAKGSNVITRVSINFLSRLKYVLRKNLSAKNASVGIR